MQNRTGMESHWSMAQNSSAARAVSSASIASKWEMSRRASVCCLTAQLNTSAAAPLTKFGRGSVQFELPSAVVLSSALHCCLPPTSKSRARDVRTSRRDGGDEKCASSCSS